MSTIAWPSSLDSVIETADYGIEWDVQVTAMRGGKIFTYGLPGARWTVTLGFREDTEAGLRPALEAILMSLEGGANRLAIGHVGRKYPNGTMRGAPTLNGAHSAGTRTLALTGVGGTLKNGDIIGLPGQMLMVTAGASPVTGQMSVTTRPALFSGYSSGTPVAWNRPTTLWIPKNTATGPFPFRAGRSRPAFSIDLVESGI